MKILKARNGIALVAVLAIMLISSLFIPVMFNLSDSALYTAVKGTDRQRASYLARTITEMSVAAFKKFDSTSNDPENDLRIAIDNLLKEKGESGKINEIKTIEIAMFKKDVEGKRYFRIDKSTGKEKEIQESDYNELLQVLEDLEVAGKNSTFELREENSTRYYQEIDSVKTEITKEQYEQIKSAQGDSTLSKIEKPLEQLCYTPVSGTGSKYDEWSRDTENYTFLGKGACVLTYEGGTTYYKKYLVDDNINGYKAGQTVTLTKEEYTTALGEYMDAVKSKTLSTLGWEVACVNNKNIHFTTTATVNGTTAKRSCVLILPTHPTEEHWFRFEPESGGNQIFVDPNKATSRIPITYDRGSGLTNYSEQVLLVYSALGNMIISKGGVLKPGVDETTATQNDYYTKGNDNYPFVLGVEPGINTTPNNDPSLAIIDGVNYEATMDLAQVNNFVAFTSTKSIRVELPINLLVNPCRADRIGDNPTKKNASLYKIMLFQAPDIIFDGSVDMMMSFYVRGNEDARRMSSVVLNAPTSTPYHYHHEQYNRTVKAGRVFFLEDCYLWVIPYGDRGSSSLDIALIGGFSETVYKKGDFQKVKIANAGDVYYFNAEVTQTKNVVQGVDENEDGEIDKYVEVDADKDGKTDTITDFVGFSLTGYILETDYLLKYSEYNDDNDWWQVWNNTQTAIFGKYMEGQLANATYKPDDFHYIGNVNDGISLISYPEADDYYVIWKN